MPFITAWITITSLSTYTHAANKKTGNTTNMLMIPKTKPGGHKKLCVMMQNELSIWDHAATATNLHVRVAKHISMPVNAFYAWSSTMHSNYVLSFQLWLSQSCTTADNERFGYNLNPKIIEVSSVLTCSIGSRNAQQVWQENSTTRRSNWPTARLLVIYTLTPANMWPTLPKRGQGTVTYAMHCQ